MWKQCTAALLILAFTGSSFCRTAIVLDYFARTSAYAAHCINKARVQMHCNGKCQMMKKLEQEEKNNQENQDVRMAARIEIIAADSFLKLAHPAPRLLMARYHPRRYEKPVDRSYRLLRPPAQV